MNAFKGEYFDNKDFTNLKLIRTDAAINFDWGSGSPHATLGSNTFSVRWEGNWDFATAGTYRVSATTNDGMRIWLDDVLILDKWFNHSKKKTYIVDRALSAGPHRIKVEYYENKKKAVAKLSWTRQ
jgi:hypothetical protein